MSSLPSTHGRRAETVNLNGSGPATVSIVSRPPASIQSISSAGGAPPGLFNDDTDSMTGSSGRRGFDLTGFAPPPSEDFSQASVGPVTTDGTDDGYQDDGEKPSWTSDKLLHTLETKKPEEKQFKKFGFPQIILGVVTFLVILIVLLATVVSKLSFLTLVNKFERSRHVQNEQKEAHAALLLMVMMILIPNVSGFVQSIWSSCYKAGRNNPNPSTTACLWIFLSSLLEASGMSLYVIVIVPRVPAVICLAIMNGVFALPAIFRTLSARTITSNTAETIPLLNPDNPTIDQQDSKAHVVGFEKMALRIATGIQVGALFYVPLYMGFISGKTVDGSICLLTAGVMIMVSIAWLPAIQTRTSVPSDPNHPNSARLKAAILNNFLKIIFTLCWVAILVHNADEYSLEQLDNGFSEIRNSDLLGTFLAHVLSSHIAYHVARMACAMSIQPLGFALPLTLATPIAIAMVMSGCSGSSDAKILWFQMDCLSNQADEVILVIIALSLWISQNIIVARNAWNSRSPLLALDEVLFYQSSYNSVLVEQYLLLNRREPDTFSEIVEDDPDDPSIRVYICSTMYHEEPREMKQLIDSVLKVDASVRNVFEWHIFLDGGCSGNELGPYAIQLVACLKEQIEALGFSNTDDWINSGQKIETPYGQRLEWSLPCGTPLAVHLKDGGVVKNKKRWSQVMYMYYLLQFRVPREHPRDTSASYILTTDADIMFEPEDVQALVLLLSRDKRVGACCGRTFAKGNGPVYWYQIFDYAVGHWFQKTAEHVLGTVLCCPGCFSLYRIDALRDCLLQYSSGVHEAFDFLTKDMGEDRWLCTLLVMAGWRLDYSAVASNTTFVPETFDEFFNQRRRWIVSTLANQVELLSNWRIAVKMNDSVSMTFILYQGAMVFSSLVSPATTILVMVGGVKYSLPSVSLETIIAWVFSGVGLYCLLVLLTNKRHQLLISKIYTALFAILMGSVVVGVATQVADEFILYCPDDVWSNETSTTLPPGFVDPCAVGIIGNLSVTSVYLFGMIGLFVVAAFLHPAECLDLIQGIWYLLCLPAGYLVLTVFAFINLNDRSWGTRTKASPSTISSPSQFGKTILRGLGLWDNESVWHFFGRCISCRCAQEAPKEAEPHPYAIMEEKQMIKSEKSTWVLNEDATQAICEPVNKLIDFLKNHKDDEDLSVHTAELTKLLVGALHACPSLANWGRWTRCWDEKKLAFKIPRGNGSYTDKSFWEEMADEVAAHMKQNYSWNLTTRNETFLLPDGHKNIGIWLEEQGLSDAYMFRTFTLYGYSDTTFVTDLKEDDLRELGMPNTLQGRAHMRKMLDAITRLPKNTLPDTIPPTIQEWLDMLCLGFYKYNFQRCGYEEKDLALLEGLDVNGLKRMGIVKRAHLEKLQKAIDRLTKLLIQGRSPEGKSPEKIKIQEIRDLVNRLRETELSSTVLYSRQVLNDEESFWKQLIETKLDPKLESISNVGGLKQKLASLRNVAIIVLFLINAIWILVMIELAQGQTESLNIFSTNPLGFLFLLVYGSIFIIQFLALLWHRVSTAVHYVASIPFPARASEEGTNHRYADIRPQ